MHSDDISSLRGILTHSEPLGPIEQGHIVDDVAISLLDDQVSPFREVTSKPYMLLLGRKGAGKSAILAEIRLKITDRRKHPSNHEHLPAPGKPFIIAVMSWEHFHQLARNVSTQYKADDFLADIIPPEHFTELWYQMLWDEIIQHFFNYTHFSDASEALAAVNDYMNADSYFKGPADREARILFNAARDSILAFLAQRKSHLYFLFDSMENYPVRNSIFSTILSGLFQALSIVNHESPNVRISFCIPEEIESFVKSSSANIVKEFASSYRIKWTPYDLLRIIAHRFRLSMLVHDEQFYHEIKRLDFSRREHVHELFNRIFPASFRNGIGVAEDPLAYIIRHTQLLPRHVLLVFNAILSRNYHATGGFRRIETSAIRDGVNHVHEILASQVLLPYERIYPKLIKSCRVLLPDLNPVCSYSELRRMERRFGRIIEDDIVSVWHTLFQMGILGRVAGDHNDESQLTKRHDRYCYGHFHFNIDRAFGMATNSEYCFHPIFSRAFGMTYGTQDTRVVYPANVEMVTLE